MASFISHDGTLDRARDHSEPQKNDEGLRLAQSRFLDELPGAVFAAITLIWIVLSFVNLIW